MSSRYVQTEDARAEQWRMLKRFSYEPNIHRFWNERNLLDNDDAAKLIAGCIRQGFAYFDAASNAPLDISPLLYYYGYNNLLIGAATLKKAQKLEIANHGMRLQTHNLDPRDTEKRELSNIEIVPVDSKFGGLQVICDALSSNVQFPVGASYAWTLGDIFGSVPDLLEEFSACYVGKQCFLIPVQYVKQRDVVFERVHDKDTESLSSKLSNVEGLASAYLLPQFNDSKTIVLRRKLGGTDIGIYSMFGRKFLPVGHIKGGNLISPPPTITLLMGLYALSYISRYKPERWNPFVRNDETGERLIVERFLHIVERYSPNLVLNQIYDEQLHFVPATLETGARDSKNDLSTWSETDLTSLVSEQIDKHLEQRDAPHRF